MEFTLCTQGILSILLVTIVCVTIGISYQDTLIIIILTALVLFSINLGKLYYLPNRPVDITNTNLVNDNSNTNMNNLPMTANSTLNNNNIQNNSNNLNLEQNENKNENM